MNKKQFDNLSASLSKAINPTARKIEATAKILEHIEPLPVVSKPTHEVATSAAVGEIGCQVDRFSHEESVDAPVENTMAKMTMVAKSQPSPWPMATVVKTALRNRTSLNVSMDVFNLFNRVNIKTADTAFTKSGIPVSAFNPRQLQFALRINF